MKLTARGWSRNMGSNTLAEYDLQQVDVRRDPNRTLNRNSARIFKGFTEVALHWVQQLRYTGEYRMELTLDDSDIVRLFKTAFGSELGVYLLDHHGFTVSPELQKRLLGQIKLADLTLGDLAGIAAPEKEEKHAVEVAQVRSLFPRRGQVPPSE